MRHLIANPPGTTEAAGALADLWRSDAHHNLNDISMVCVTPWQWPYSN